MSYASAREWSALKGILPRVFSSPAMRFAGQLFSFPVQVVAGELFRPNPWGDKSSPMYGKGPGSLEHAQALKNADAAGRTATIETDYVTPTVTQRVDNFLTNTNQIPDDSVAANIAANEADKAAVNSGDMSVNDYFFGASNAQTPTNVTQGALSPKEAWLAKTANSPAQQSGAWDSDEGREQLWQTHLANQQWRKDKGRNFTHGEFLN